MGLGLKKGGKYDVYIYNSLKTYALLLKSKPYSFIQIKSDIKKEKPFRMQHPKKFLISYPSKGQAGAIYRILTIN